MSDDKAAAKEVKKHEAKDKNHKGKLIDAKIFAPFQVYYEGVAQSISAINESGPFDILPDHHNFITMLIACDIVVHVPDEEPRIIRITRGLMHVRQNKVIVFLDV